MPIQVQPIARTHIREGFDCGEPSLNTYIQRYALQNDERNMGRTFVAVEEGDSHVIGYYTLATGRISFENVPSDKKLPPHIPVPVILVGRLAVDNRQQGNKIGTRLLLHALWRAHRVSEQIGVYAVEVDALHDKAAQFYEKYGFKPLLDNPLHLYISMKTVKALELDFDEASL